jgi:hypothetical protein
MSTISNLPPHQLSFNKKNKEWRKKFVDWADSKTFSTNSLVRKSVLHKKINYDLLRGVLHRSDMELVLNPEHLQAGFIPDKIPHYPIMNSKLNVLIGEESKRVFDFRVVVTNPNSISDIENTKRDALRERLQQLVADQSQSEEEFNQKLEQINDYFTYEYQDIREVRANCLLNHYMKELNIPLEFNKGFRDATAVAEEIYQCDIRGGEPTFEKVNPLKIRVYKSGYSNKIEDADMIAIEDYWQPGKIVDTYYEEIASLSASDRKKLQDLLDNNVASGASNTDSMDNLDERNGYINMNLVGEEAAAVGYYFDPMGLFSDGVDESMMPYDIAGNVRVLRVYWKSRRKIKKVKSYDPETGEETFDFYPETYIIDKDKGEEETIFWVNEAWEGTKIGKDIYIGMRPRAVQYNRLSNPSRCHFGIVGSIYNINDDRPFSLVDMMKPYNYLYDAIHDRLNKHLAKNWGKIIQLDLAKVPKGWDVEKWLYFAKTNNLAIVDSFKEGNSGVATGKLAGALNNASSGVIDAEMGNIIQQEINLLEFIKQEMSDVVGISKQREGQISNRETVGGVERATLQSSHITEWIFYIHEDVKKRALECFLETAKIALKGRSLKFNYILGTGALQVSEIDGDEFAESDYGLIVDSSNAAQELNAKMDTLAQAALQNQTLNFSTIMKLYGSCSIAEKQRMVENNEKKMQEQQQQMQQQQMQIQQEQIKQQAATEQAKMEQEYKMHTEDNETKILVAQINSQAEADRLALMNQQEDEDVYTQKDRAELAEKIREFDLKLKLDIDKFNHEKSKDTKDQELKNKQINKSNKASK